MRYFINLLLFRIQKSKTLPLLFGLIFFTQSNAQVKWPPVNLQTQPWTRWWWHGSAVNATDLTKNLEKYKAVGLGGVELTPIYGVRGSEQQFLTFLSPHWMKMLVHTLHEAKRLNLGVDLANATGWPFGGPWVSEKDGSKTVYFKKYYLTAGKTLQEKIEYRNEGFVRTANNRPVKVDTIVFPVQRNNGLQELALDQIQYPSKLIPQYVMAYEKNGGIVDLTNKVGPSGELNWIATAGNWEILAIFVGNHGKMVERAAPGGEGYAIDHFSKTAVMNYLKHFDTAFREYDISNIRAFFNDSYEVDDAKGQANWSPTFVSDFEKIKGYDLRKYFYTLADKKTGDLNSRVLFDYRSVIDELLLENFTRRWQRWSKDKGVLVRNQSHGSPANTLDLYGAVDIPETEGSDILRFKFASSAANVTGKHLASAEAATWLDEHFLSSLGDVKKAVDLYFLGGVNHIVYHGIAYSPDTASWPGWLFYAAVHFQPTNPQWKHFKTLNDYITRVQSFLQSGQSDNDVLIYYPIVDAYSKTGGELLQHFDGMEKNFTGTDFEFLSRRLLNEGCGFDFISDRQIQNLTVKNGYLRSGKSIYRTIILPACKLISEKTFHKLMELARQGAQITVYKSLPSDVPGLSQLERRRKLFKDLVAQLTFTDNPPVKTAKVGTGELYMSDDLAAIISMLDIEGQEMLKKQLHFIRRNNADGKTYFINNRSDEKFEGWVQLKGKIEAVALFDPMKNNKGLAQWRRLKDDKIEVRLQLNSFESIIVRTYNSHQHDIPFQYTIQAGATEELDKRCSIEFLEGGPILPSGKVNIQLGSWTELPGQDVKHFAGIVKYNLEFPKPANDVALYRINFGKVHETAEIFLNGNRLGILIGPVFEIVIDSGLLKNHNQLEIRVANLMANRISYMDRNNIPWKVFYNINMPARIKENTTNGLFNAALWKPLPSGVLGPIRITPLKVD